MLYKILINLLNTSYAVVPRNAGFAFGRAEVAIFFSVNFCPEGKN